MFAAMAAQYGRPGPLFRTYPVHESLSTCGGRRRGSFRFASGVNASQGDGQLQAWLHSQIASRASWNSAEFGAPIICMATLRVDTQYIERDSLKHISLREAGARKTSIEGCEMANGHGTVTGVIQLMERGIAGGVSS